MSNSIFVSLGQLGPGDNIGHCAAKSSATAMRGQYYGVASAVGKIGTFVGTYVIPIAQKNAPSEVRSGQDPFFISSSLCLFSAVIAYFLFPRIGQVCCSEQSVEGESWLTSWQDTIAEEDMKFRDFLEANGYDTATLGNEEQRN